MEYISVNEAKKRLGVTSQTIRNYIKAGKIKAEKTATGRYVITEDELKKMLPNSNREKIWAFYVRSSSENKNILESQENMLNHIYGNAKYVIKDSASGLNENRKGLHKLIQLVKDKKITDIGITNKDRLSRFGVKYLIEIFNIYHVELHVLHENDNEKKNLNEELMKDFMSLIASFSGRFYAMRSVESKMKLLKQAEQNVEKNNDNRNSDI
jgi:excisionase family DNA binding protein